jgi:hypothetical protein
MAFDFGLEDISIQELSVGGVEGVVVEHDVNGASISKPHDPKLVNKFNNCARVRMLCAM